MAYKILTHYPECPDNDELATMYFRAEFTIRLRMPAGDPKRVALFGLLADGIRAKLEASFADGTDGRGHVEWETHADVCALAGSIDCTTDYVYEGDWDDTLVGQLQGHFDEDGELVLPEGAEHHVLERIWYGTVMPVWNDACAKAGYEGGLRYRELSIEMRSCDIGQN